MGMDRYTIFLSLSLCTIALAACLTHLVVPIVTRAQRHKQSLRAALGRDNVACYTPNLVLHIASAVWLSVMQRNIQHCTDTVLGAYSPSNSFVKYCNSPVLSSVRVPWK